MTRDDWRTWLIAITRPIWIDNEEPPAECGLIPWWTVQTYLSRKYGFANVERKLPLGRRLELPDLYGDFLANPTEQDWCAITPDEYGWYSCNGACK